MVPKIRALFIIEDTALMEDLQILADLYLTSIKVIGKCYNFQDGIKAQAGLQPDLLLLDLDFISKKEFQELLHIVLNHCFVIGLASNLEAFTKTNLTKLNGLILNQLIGKY